MKANELKLNELVSFSDGYLSLHGRRLILQDLHAFAQFRSELVNMLGVEHMRKVLTRFGFATGQADAAAMKRIFSWNETKEWLSALQYLQSMYGAGRCRINHITLSPHVEIDIGWHDSSEAEAFRLRKGLTDHTVCWMTMGYASGYASFCLDRNIYFLEQTCMSKGDGICSAIGKDESSWGDTLTPYKAYFQADDIWVKYAILQKNLKPKRKNSTGNVAPCSNVNDKHPQT